MIKPTTIKEDPISLERIKKILLKRYEKTHGGYGDRRLVLMKEVDSVGSNIIFFVLQGSPPKGYALWIEGISKLLFYDATGREFKMLYLSHGVNGV